MQFAFLSQDYASVKKLHGEIVGFYFENLAAGITYTVEKASAQMDEFGWESGWRMEDQDLVIWSGGCPDNCVFNVQSTFIVLETATMQVKGYGGLYLVPEVLEELKRIDETN